MRIREYPREGGCSFSPIYSDERNGDTDTQSSRVSKIVLDLRQLGSGEPGEGRYRHIGYEPQKQGPPHVAIGTEATEAVCGIIRIECANLPSQLNGNKREGREEDQMRTSKEAGYGPKHDCPAIKTGHPVLRCFTEA